MVRNRSYIITSIYDIRYLYSRPKGTGIFFGRGIPNLQKKIGFDKTATPPISTTNIFRQQTHNTPYPLKQAKIVLKSVFLNKIKTHILWSSCDSPHFGHQKFYNPHIFFPKIYDTHVLLGPTPFRRKCRLPNTSCSILVSLWTSVGSHE